MNSILRRMNRYGYEYSYFSLLHHSFSCINFFHTSNSLIRDKTDTSIHSIIISDHAPISLVLHSKQFHKHPSRWRFNVSLLRDTKFDRFLSREWASFMDTNASPNSSPLTLGTATKKQ